MQVPGGEELELSEILRAVCDASLDGVYLHKDGRVIHANLAAEQMLGYGSGELVGLDVRDLTAPRSRSITESSIANQTTVVTELWGLKRDGSEVRLEIRPRNVVVQGVPFRAAVVRDLSAQDAAERQRKAFVALLRATFDSAADGMLALGMGGRIALWNEPFRAMWSLPEEVLRLGDDHAAVALVAGQLVDPVGFLRSVEETRHAPLQNLDDVLELRDGRVFERRSLPQFIDNEVVGRVLSFRDVTAQRAAERASRLAVQMRDEFLAIASHELFAPITALAIAFRGLRESKAVAPEVIDRLWENAARQIDRLVRLIHELLDVARIDGAHLDLKRGEVDLRELAQEVIARFAFELEREGSTVALVAPEPVRGTWDRGRLEQVISNLLGNAIKFGQGKPIEISIQRIGAEAELAVRDQGIGVPPEQQQRIFQRFQRAVSPQHYAGLGLGLYITLQIVEAHGGRLALSSAPGHGAKFTVHLPLVGR